MNLSIELPHVPARRNWENRTAREADDIIALFTCLDENKLSGELPRYAAHGPDSMPSVRLYDGDLYAVMEYLHKLEAQTAQNGCVLAAICVIYKQCSKSTPHPAARRNIIGRYNHDTINHQPDRSV